MRRIKEILLIALATIIILVIVLATDNKVSKDIIGSPYRKIIILSLIICVLIGVVVFIIRELRYTINVLADKEHFELNEEVHTRFTVLRNALIYYRRDKKLRRHIWGQMKERRLLNQLLKEAPDLEFELSEYGKLFRTELAELQSLQESREEKEKPSSKEN